MLLKRSTGNFAMCKNPRLSSQGRNTPGSEMSTQSDVVLELITATVEDRPCRPNSSQAARTRTRTGLHFERTCTCSPRHTGRGRQLPLEKGVGVSVVSLNSSNFNPLGASLLGPRFVPVL